MYDLPVCRARIVDQILSGELVPNATIFSQTEDGSLAANLTGPIIFTLSGCEAICGLGIAKYPNREISQRLITWLFPIVVLYANMHNPPLGWGYTILSSIHLLGDPIDSLWSLLTKLEVASRGIKIARSVANFRGENAINYATFLSAIEELMDTSTDFSCAKRETREIFHQIPAESSRLVFNKAARALCDSRVHEATRTIISIVTYLVALGTAFLAAVDTSSGVTPPGNRIAYAIMFSWLIPAVIFSAITGRFVSRRACADRLVQTVNERNFSNEIDRPALRRIAHLLDDDQSWKRHPWIGAMYIYRPEKRIASGGQDDHSPMRLLGVALSIIFMPFVVSVATSWVTPIAGFKCRHFTEIIVFALYLISAFISWLTWHLKIWTSKSHFKMTMIKDAIVMVCAFVLLVLTSCGIFNSCWCVSAEMSRHSDAIVSLDTDEQRREMSKNIYPALAYGTVVIHLIMVYLILRWIGWKSL
jgi:hypothetical protein